MSNLAETKIELRGIASLLRDKRAFVPKYQRSYAWETENVDDLFKDINGAITSGSKEYFLGSLVISERDQDRPEIVDGQQRLATTLIFIAAVRDYLLGLDTTESKERSSLLTERYIAEKDISTLELTPKLSLNDNDHDYFQKRIISAPSSSNTPVPTHKKSHERINAAASTAKQFISNLVAVDSDATTTLLNWVEYLDASAKIIIVRVPDESNAFVIFETLNDRGLALAVSDLLKNYLFYRSGDRISEVQNRWIQVVSNIEAAEDEQAIINFIRNYWSSKYGLVRERELFEKIKLSVSSKQKTVELVNGLYAASKLYSAMVTCDDDFWSKYPTAAKSSMQTLNFFRMIQIRPLVLAILENFDEKETVKALKHLVNAAVRLLIVGGLGGGALEAAYCQNAVKINDGEIDDSKKLIESLKTMVPNDTTFRTAFEAASVSKAYLARYYLRTLEEANAGEKEPEFLPNGAADAVTLEHVFPQKPKQAEWPQFDEDESKAYCKRLGNLALMKKTPNIDSGNMGFSGKKAALKASNFELTSMIGGYSQWTPEEIKLRQKTLAEIAINAWPIPS